MIAVNPKDRLTLQEIKDHEWYNGPVATQEEILKNFGERKKNLKPHKEDGHQSPQKAKASKRAKSSKSQKKAKKYTKFLQVSDGDELVE